MVQTTPKRAASGVARGAAAIEATPATAVFRPIIVAEVPRALQDDAEQRHAEPDGDADHADRGDGGRDRQPMQLFGVGGGLGVHICGLAGEPWADFRRLVSERLCRSPNSAPVSMRGEMAMIGPVAGREGWLGLRPCVGCGRSRLGNRRFFLSRLVRLLPLCAAFRARRRLRRRCRAGRSARRP